MLKKLLLISFVFISLFLFNNSFAYDDKTTHPALTDEIVDFYNLSFPDKQLTPQQKEWIIQGSILEDTPPRWINHFYDPIYKEGWSGEHTGAYDAETVRLVSQKVIAPYGITPVSSLNWLHNEQLQADYGFYKGAKTWERGILEMIKDNEKEAYQILGYILHLMEDATVPEHTRNDTHAHELEGATGDYGSPYEEYLKKYTRETIKKDLNLAINLKNQGFFPLQKSSIDEYLISLAEYSNKYFFSKDTINDPKYQSPKIIRDDGIFGYGLDEGGKEFPLARVKIIQDEIGRIKIEYSLKNKKEEEILSAYFSRLSRQVILNGAGVIDLFHNKVKQETEYPTHLVTYDFSSFNYFRFPNVSITGELKRVGFFFGKVSSFISGIFQLEEGKSVSDELGANLIGQIADSREQSLQNQQEQSGSQAAQSQTSEIEETQQLAAAPPSSNGGQQFGTQGAQQLLAGILSQLNLIKSQTEELVRQEEQSQTANTNFPLSSNQVQISYGGGGGAPVIITTTGGGGLTSSAGSEQTSLTEPEQSSSTNSGQSSSASAVPQINHLVISEIYPDKTGNNFDFVELYNPTNAEISLVNYSLKIQKESATVTSPLGSFSSEHSVAAKSFFLVGLDEYANGTSTLADVSRSSYFLFTTKAATVLLMNGDEFVDQVNYNPDNLSPGQSLERRVYQNNECVSAQNGGEFLGNGCDMDSETDFEVRDAPNPQNSQSLPEPRQKPTTPENFTVQYNSSAMELILSWDASRDYSGATSTLTYEIAEINNTSSTIMTTTTSTTFTTAINEVGRNYRFSLRAFDKDGLSYDGAESEINVPNSTFIIAQQLDKSVSELGTGNGQFYQYLGNGLLGSPKKVTFRARFQYGWVPTGVVKPYYIRTDFWQSDNPGYGNLVLVSSNTCYFIGDNVNNCPDIQVSNGVDKDYTVPIQQAFTFNPEKYYKMTFLTYQADVAYFYGSPDDITYSYGKAARDDGGGSETAPSIVKDLYFIIEAQSPLELPADISQSVPQNFETDYSTSTSELSLSWQEPRYFGAGSPSLTYEVADVSYLISSSTSVVPETVTSAATTAIVIREVGRKYKFSVQAFDTDGNSSLVALSKDVSIPYSLLDKFVIAGQTNYSAAETGTGNGQFYQYVGSGLSGKLGAIAVKTSSPGYYLRIDIHQFADSDYSISDGYYYGAAFCSTISYISGPPCLNYYVDSDIITVPAGSDFTFDPAKYYKLYFLTYQSQSTFYGSPDAGSYPNGRSAKDNGGGSEISTFPIQSLYFIILSSTPLN